MACATVFDAFKVATEHLSHDIYRRASFTSPLQNVIPEGTFPENVGTTISTFTVEPNEPTADTTAGSAISVSEGVVTNLCSNSWTDLNIGFTETTYSPKRLQYRGPLFCKDTQYFHHDPDQFLNAYVDTLSQYVSIDYDTFLFYYYARFVPIYSITATAFNSLGSVSSTLTADVPTSELTQEALDKLAVNLIYDRSVPENADGNGGWISLGPSGPLWTLLISTEASLRVKQNNADFRTDLNYGNPNSLLNRLGASEAVKNFRHLPWALPMRFAHDGSKFTHVPRFVSSAATKGYKTAVNPNWISPTTAPYEAALVLSPYVMKREHVKPKSKVGPAKWPDTGYMGDWEWVTGPDALSQADGDGCVDPLHKYGRHFGEIICAPRPGPNPRSGAILFYKRCPDTLTLVDCT